MRKLKRALLFLFLIPVGFLRADDDVWHLLVEPSFLHHEAAWPIAGSKTAVLVPARFSNGEVLPLKRDEVSLRKVTPKKILASAPGAASAVLAGLNPRYVRDENKVIQYAVLESESPLTASSVLAPEFTKVFAETLGPDLLVAIPNRFRVFIFPRTAFSRQNFSDLIFVEYQSTAWPVTREIFELRKGKLIAIGSFR